MHDIVDPVRDRRCIDRKETRVETARPPRRRDRARDEMQNGQVGIESGFREFGPGPVRRRRARRRVWRRATIRFPRRFRGSRQAPARALSPRSAARPPASAVFRHLVERLCDRHQPVVRLGASAGKHEFARHEDMLVMALAEQDLRRFAPSDRRGSASRRLSDGHSDATGSRSVIGQQLRRGRVMEAVWRLAEDAGRPAPLPDRSRACDAPIARRRSRP